MKVLKQTLTVLAIAAVLAAAFLAVKGSGDGIFSGRHHRGHRLTAERTLNLVTEIRKISEFTTACYFAEKPLVAGKKIKLGSYIGGMLILPPGAGALVPDTLQVARLAYIVHGKVRAGYDLSGIADDGLFVRGDTLYLTLPEPKIFDVIVNPGDVEEFDRQGSWSDEEINRLLGNARAEIEADAIKDGILLKAEDTGKEKLAALFATFGFPNVTFVKK